jgi:hypothetical protein
VQVRALRASPAHAQSVKSLDTRLLDLAQSRASDPAGEDVMQHKSLRPRSLVRVTGRQGVFAVVSVTGDLVEVVHAESGRSRIVPAQRIGRAVRATSRAGAEATRQIESRRKIVAALVGRRRRSSR